MGNWTPNRCDSRFGNWPDCGDREQNALTVHYDAIHALANTLRTTISSKQRLPKLDQSVPAVLSGGTTIPKGFLERFTFRVFFFYEIKKHDDVADDHADKTNDSEKSHEAVSAEMSSRVPK